LATQQDLKIGEIAKAADITSLECSSRTAFRRYTVFSRRITVMQGRLRHCDEFSSGDCRASRPWIASSYEVIRERCFYECKSLASVTFDSDRKVSRFGDNTFASTGLTLIHIPSSIEVIYAGCSPDATRLRL
jgi:hypothetical protein